MRGPVHGTEAGTGLRAPGWKADGLWLIGKEQDVRGAALWRIQGGGLRDVGPVRRPPAGAVRGPGASGLARCHGLIRLCQWLQLFFLDTDWGNGYILRARNEHAGDPAPRTPENGLDASR